MELDKRQPERGGGDRGNQYTGGKAKAPSGANSEGRVKSAQRTAEVLGVSARQVERVPDHGGY
jgi:hypothetical protein